MRRVSVACLVFAIALAGCSDDAGDGLAGTYSNPDVGSIELDGEGGATISIPDEPSVTNATYARVEGEDWDLIITDDDAQAEAILDGDDLVFYPATYRQDEEFTLTKE